jgi:hypothetical protein
MATRDVDRMIGATVLLRPQELAEIRIAADADGRSLSQWCRVVLTRALSRETAAADRRHGENRGGD